VLRVGLRCWWFRRTSFDFVDGKRAAVSGFTVARFVLTAEGRATKGRADGSAVDEELGRVDV
jgi:hypothetical protein